MVFPYLLFLLNQFKAIREQVFKKKGRSEKDNFPQIKNNKSNYMNAYVEKKTLNNKKNTNLFLIHSEN